jgi:acyl carrier protein
MINIDKVKELLAASCPYEPDEISLGSDLVADLEFDSFCMMDMLLAFEKEFGISIPDRDLRLFVTVSDIADYLEKKTAPDAMLSVDNGSVV